MTTVRINYREAVKYLSRIYASSFDIQPIIYEDRKRMLEIMNQYDSAELDYTDTAIMALSERLNITQVYTFDRRDFGIFRPRHCDYLELMPS